MSDTTETETGTNTDTTDEPSKAELHERVEQLESTVEKLMPSRRDALRMGVAGLAGAAGVVGASQSVDASTGSAGTIGSTSDRPDLITDNVAPRSIASDYLYAGEFSGGTPSARLDNALAAASQGTSIYLESADYPDPHTVSQIGVGLVTPSPGRGRFEDNLTLDSNQSYHRIGVKVSCTVSLTGNEVTLDIRNPGTLNISGSRCLVRIGGGLGGAVTLTSSSSDCVVIATGSQSVTNNGANNNVV